MSRKENIVFLLLGTFILSIVGLYNGYPLVTSDTGTYIYSGFENVIPLDRPIVYGFLIRHLSLEYSLWFVVFFQNLLMAFVLLETLKIFISNLLKLKQAYVILLLGLTLFTGISWYTNQLMPDFFAPILLLSIYILFRNKNLSKWKQAVFYGLILLSCLVHFSHMLIGMLLLVFLMLTNKKWEFKRRRGVYMFVVMLSVFILLPSINYLVEKKFIMGKASHVFLMAHLADNGILDRFLQENCEDVEFKNCSLCEMKDSLPMDLSGFLWTSDVVMKSGGWEGSKEEYDKIINATLTRPKYLAANVFKSFSAGIQPLFRVGIGQGVSHMGEDSPPYGQIQKHMPKELANFRNGKQNQWQGMALKIEYVNLLHKLLIIACLFLLLALRFSVLWYKLDKQSRNFVAFVLLAILINSLVTGGLNAPNERFHARVVWMFPLSMLLMLGSNFKLIYSHVSDKLKKA